MSDEEWLHDVPVYRSRWAPDGKYRGICVLNAVSDIGITTVWGPLAVTGTIDGRMSAVRLDDLELRGGVVTRPENKRAVLAAMRKLRDEWGNEPFPASLQDIVRVTGLAYGTVHVARRELI